MRAPKSNVITSSLKKQLGLCIVFFPPKKKNLHYEMPQTFIVYNTQTQKTPIIETLHLVKKKKEEGHHHHHHHIERGEFFVT